MPPFEVVFNAPHHPITVVRHVFVENVQKGVDKMFFLSPLFSLST
jgi:hypothetical protein